MPADRSSSQGTTCPQSGTNSVRIAPARIWPYLIALLLLPAIVLWREDNLLFTPPGQIDPWVYLGFFRNLVNFKCELFPGTYYGSRLSWVLPGFLLHSVFPPVAASCVLHLSVLWVSMHSLFTTLRLTVGARTAFLSVLLFSVNPQVWYAAGWDYPDGAGIAYCLLAMALLTRAAYHTTPARYLLLAGMAIAGLVYDNLFYVVLVPLALLYYVVLRWSRQRSGAIRVGLHAGLWTIVGFLTVTLVLCAINYRLDGEFWFYGPSLGVAAGLAQNNPYYISPWTNDGLVPGDWFLVAAALTALVLLPFRIRNAAWKSEVTAVLFSLQLLLAVAGFAYLQFLRRTPVLGLPYYASSLLPFVFLVIGSTYCLAVERMSRHSYILLCCLSVALFVGVWSGYATTLTPLRPAMALPAAAIGGIALTGALWQRRRALGAVLAIAGFAVLSYEVRTDKYNAPHTFRGVFERTMRGAAQIESVRHGRVVRFWYDNHEPASFDYAALNSLYLSQYTLVQTPFPELSCDKSLPNDAVFVVLSNREHAAELAWTKLSTCLSSWALRSNLVSSTATRTQDGSYTTAVLTTEPDPSQAHALRVAPRYSGWLGLEIAETPGGSQVLPPEYWVSVYPAGDTALRSVPDGIAVKSLTVGHASIADYGPFKAPAAGHYRFTMNYTLVSGVIVFGVRRPGSADWMEIDLRGRQAGSAREMECAVELKRGQEFMIEVGNNNKVDVPASLVIHKLTGLVREP